MQQLEPQIFVAGQIEADAIPDLAQAGFTHLICHRPDGEAPDQPAAADMQALAERHGLTWVHAPARGMPGPDAIATTADALAGLPDDGKALLFCKSGMRSTVAWAFARRGQGHDADTLRASAAAAGYDLSQLTL